MPQLESDHGHSPREVRETIRVVIGAGVGDPVSLGEEVARFAPGTSLTVVRAEMVRVAMANRGCDVAIDVFCHKVIWERVVSTCYAEGLKVTAGTGVIDHSEQAASPAMQAAARAMRLANEARYKIEDAQRALAREANLAAKAAPKNPQGWSA